MTTQNGGVGGGLEGRDSRYPRAAENSFFLLHLFCLKPFQLLCSYFSFPFVNHHFFLIIGHP
jgi:hypothetical protein